MHIAFEFRLSDAGFLKIDNVMKVSLGRSPHRLERADRQAGEERRIKSHNASNPLRRQQRHLPHHQPTPVVVNDDRFVNLQSVK